MQHLVLRHHTVLSILTVLVGLTVFVSCSDKSPVEPTEEDPPIELTVGLSATQAGPASRVQVTGIPDNIDDVYAVVTTVATTVVTASNQRGARVEQGFAIIEQVGDDRELIVPVHPVTPMQGGAVNLRITNGSNVTSNTVEMTVGPLTRAPGAFADVVGKVQTFMDSWLAANGTTRETLRTTPLEDLHATEIPMLIVHNLLDHPDNENSLVAMAAGDIPLLTEDEEPFDRELLDALIAVSEMGDFADERIAFTDTLTTPEILPDGESFAGRAWLVRSAQLDCIEAPRFSIDADDCYKLSEVMQYQTSLELEAAGSAQKVQDSIKNALLSAMSYTPATKVGMGIATVFWAIATMEESHRALYPSVFISDETDFVADPELFPEDFDENGKWSDFKVGAASAGWNFEKALLDALKKAYGASKGLDAPGPKEEFKGVQIKYNKMIKNKLTKNVKKGLQGDLQEEIDLEYCPQEWHAIICDEFAQGSSPDGGLDVNMNDNSYKPKEVGTALLKVETKDVFGLGKRTSETKSIKTERLEVSVDPFQATADVEESITFFANVTAQDQSVDWSVIWPPGNEGFFTDGGNQISVGTPKDPWENPFRVVAKSTSDTGLRSNGRVNTDPRVDTVLVTWSGEPKIMITPRAKCIDNNEEVILTATVTGLSEPTIVWSKVHGFASFEPSGNTCKVTGVPQGFDDTRIRATIQEFPEAIANADIRTSTCTCGFNINIQGDATWNTEGFDIAHTSGPGGFQWTVNNPNPGGSENLSMSLVTLSPPAPGELGTYRINAAFSNGSGAWAIAQNDSVAKVEMEFLEHTSVGITGIVNGNLIRRDNPEDPELITSSINIHMTFRSGLWASGSGWPCD